MTWTVGIIILGRSSHSEPLLKRYDKRTIAFLAALYLTIATLWLFDDTP